MKTSKKTSFILLLLSLILSFYIFYFYGNIISFKEILSGLKYNIFWTTTSIFFGVILGFLSAYSRYFKYKISVLFEIFSEIFRGTPILLQISIACFLIPKFLINLSDFTWCTIIFILNSSSYLAEGFLSQFNSIEESYWNTSKLLGFSHRQTMKNIIIPMVIKNSSGIIKNEIITLLKDASIVSVIGFSDILSQARNQSRKTGNYFLPLIFTGLIFFILNIVQSFFKSLYNKLFYRSITTIFCF